MNHFISPAWQDTLRANGFDRFGALWEAPFEALDRPNHRGGKESFSLTGVLDLKDPEGRPVKLFIKKQQNFYTRSLLHPIRGIPVAQRELNNILEYSQRGIPVVTPVLLAKKNQEGKRRAVLLLEFLDGYMPLSHFIETSRKGGKTEREAFVRIIRKTAEVVQSVHRFGFRYGGMYPKHVFARTGKGQPDVKLIDLEKSRYRPMGRTRMAKDLEALYRHGGWRAKKTDIVRFLAAYLGRPSLGAQGRTLIRKVQARHKQKQHRQHQPS